MPQAEIDPADRFQARTGRHSWLPRVPLFVAAGDIVRQFESAHQLQNRQSSTPKRVLFLYILACFVIFLDKNELLQYDTAKRIFLGGEYAVSSEC